jgi:FMN-dependent NADH-azoreductase
MANLLVINSSSAREESISRALAEEAAARLMEANPDAVVVHRDLGAGPGSSLAADRLASSRGGPPGVSILEQHSGCFT